jgi:hypothetical protein
MAPRGEELLHEDGWTFVEGDNQIQLWRKFNFFVYYNPSKDTFSPIFLFDPRNANKKEN